MIGRSKTNVTWADRRIRWCQERDGAWKGCDRSNFCRWQTALEGRRDQSRRIWIAIQSIHKVLDGRFLTGRAIHTHRDRGIADKHKRSHGTASVDSFQLQRNAATGGARRGGDESNTCARSGSKIAAGLGAAGASKRQGGRRKLGGVDESCGVALDRERIDNRTRYRV